MAMAGRAVLHPRRQVFAGHVHGDRRAPEAAADDVPDGCAPKSNYFRFRISPEIDRDRRDGDGRQATKIGQPAELGGEPAPGADEMDAYERVLGDAMEGDADAVRARGLRRRGVANRRPGAEDGHAGARVRAGHLGAREVDQIVVRPADGTNPHRHVRDRRE